MPDPMTIDIPGDKSVSHRAIMYGALASGRSVVHGCSTGKDVMATLRCIQQLGIEHERHGRDIHLHGRGLRGLSESRISLDCGNSGTTMRLLAGMLAGQPFVTNVRGDESLSRRPMKRVFQPLMLMGASFRSTQAETAPFSVQGTFPLRSIEYDLPVPSAQVKSAILLAGLFADGETVVWERIRTRDHTERLFGASVKEQGGERRIRIQPTDQLIAREIAVPADISSAVFIIFASALTGRPVRLPGVCMNPTRTPVLDLLRSAGLTIHETNRQNDQAEPFADLLVEPSPLARDILIDRDTALLIDEIPMLAVGAAVSGVGITVKHAGELRHKESDRIALLVKNLRAIGCEVEEYEDGFASIGKNGLIGASIGTGADHRIAMAFAVAGLVLPGMVVDQPSCVDVSFPGFWDVLSRFAAVS